MKFWWHLNNGMPPFKLLTYDYREQSAEIFAFKLNFFHNNPLLSLQRLIRGQLYYIYNFTIMVHFISKNISTISSINALVC